MEREEVMFFFSNNFLEKFRKQKLTKLRLI